MSVNANYNGRSPNNTSNIKYFVPGQAANLWIVTKYLNTNVSPNVYENVITPSSSNYQNVYIPGDLFVDGSIINPSDILLKDNIVTISSELSDSIMKLKPTQFTYKSEIGRTTGREEGKETWREAAMKQKKRESNDEDEE